MKIVRRPRLQVEALEKRECPALTMKLVPGMLIISGTPRGDVLLTQGAGNKVTVQDNGVPLGTYSGVANVNLQLASHSSKKVDYDLAGNTLGGNLIINAGTNVHNDPGNQGFGLRNGRIGGSVTFTGGSGTENLYLGADGKGLNPGNLTIGGNLTFAPKANNNKLAANVLVSLPGGGKTVMIGGDVNITNTDAVVTDPLTKFGRDVTISNGQETSLLVVSLAGTPGTPTVGRNLSITNGNTAHPLAGFSTIQFTGATVGGNTSLNLGNAPDFVLIDSTSLFQGNTLINTGSGNDSFGVGGVLFDGTFNGNLSINAGDGVNDLTGLNSASLTVNGSLNLTLGNGDNTAFTIDGTIGGALNITIGNGSNNVTVTSALGGKLTWRSGNGSNSLTVGLAADNFSYIVDALFGSADDSFTLDIGTGILSGSINGGGRTTANSFTQTTGTITSTTTISNFP